MDNELRHYGIPGMKWGVRREAEDTVQPERKSKKRRITIKQLRAARKLARSAALVGLTAYTTSNAMNFSRKLPPSARSYFNKRYWSLMGPTLAVETLMVGNNIRKLYKARRKDRVNESDELRHYGIPGMKWGVRRRNFKESAKSSSDHVLLAYRKSRLSDYT